MVGGGLAGLAAAKCLAAAHIQPLVLEAGPNVGGRVTTDEVDGFLLDRGFQVLLDSYPEARRALDLEALLLRPFASGALVHADGRMRRIADPWRDPLAGMSSLVSGIFTPLDAGRMLKLRLDALASRAGDPETDTQSTARSLEARGFSRRAIESFFRPFFGGVFLDTELSAPRPWFEFLFAMFATGRATLPSRGMRALPEQLAAALPAGSVRTGARVRAVNGNSVELEGGETLRARAVILATDARHLAVVLPGTPEPSWASCATLYWAAPESPLAEPVLALNGDPRSGPVNHLCVPSDVAPSYAPAGRALVSGTTVGVPALEDEVLDHRARRQLGDWFGHAEVSAWRLLKVTRVMHSLPRLTDWRRADPVLRLGEGLYACGDHLETPSINGALRSGRRAAETLLTDWGVRLLDAPVA